ncbi:hypothetical protein [Rufibacter roseus]|uniref:DUF2798 domain-containing protein n=1 Tax=Rufibacter roseus TaxID=1567108 RepID=A0ABW2DNX2_9BACT|nr:hypothetical protein [Rufibacter roseus]
MAKTVKRHPFQRDWRRDLIIAGLVSLVLAMTLLLYTFGLTSDFLLRLLNAFLIIFIMISGTVFLIIPSVNWAFGRFSKQKAPAKPAPKRNLPKKRP